MGLARDEPAVPRCVWLYSLASPLLKAPAADLVQLGGAPNRTISIFHVAWMDGAGKAGKMSPTLNDAVRGTGRPCRMTRTKIF